MSASSGKIPDDLSPSDLKLLRLLAEVRLREVLRFPETPEEVARAEAELAEHPIELPLSLRDPRAVFARLTVKNSRSWGLGALARRIPRSVTLKALAAAAVLVALGLFMRDAAIAQRQQREIESLTAQLMPLLQERRRLHLDRHVTFEVDDERHPATDPARARPLLVAGQEVYLKGAVAASVIQSIKVRVVPGAGPEGDPYEKDIEILRRAGEDVSPFSWNWTAPGDARMRKVIIKLVPYPEALAAAPEDLREDRLTYRVNLDCRDTGVVGYVPDRKLSLAVPKSIKASQRDDYQLTGSARVDGFVCALVHNGTGWTLQNGGRPQRVRANQPFSIPCQFGEPAKVFRVIGILVAAESDWKEGVQQEGDFPVIDRQLDRTDSAEVVVEGE